MTTARLAGRALLLALLAWWTWRFVPRALDTDRIVMIASLAFGAWILPNGSRLEAVDA